ncbi:MAG: DUF835 domain-containing protein [Methanomassiliicoccales archaeon]
MQIYTHELANQAFPSVSVRSGLVEQIIDFGRIYLLKDERLEKTLSMTKSLADTGKDVLCISRYHPSIMVGRLPLRSMQLIWLGERAGEDRISPDNLGRLKHLIAIFAHEHKNAVVVIDGLEYLALFNDFHRLNVFYEELNDIVMDTRAVLLFPIDERLIEASDIARLKRFAEII